MLTLDQAHLITMLGDPLFYTACPDFAEQQVANLADHAAYVEKLRAAACGDCGDTGIQPTIARFVRQLRQIAGDPVKAAAVRNYLSRKKGYVVSSVLLRYGRHRTERVTF